MGKLAIGVLSFAAGAAVGAYFVQWYIKSHPGSTIIAAAGEQIFGEGSTGARIVAGIGGAIDEVRN